MALSMKDRIRFFSGVRTQRKTRIIQALTALTFLKESAVGFTLPEGQPKDLKSRAKIQLDPAEEV